MARLLFINLIILSFIRPVASQTPGPIDLGTINNYDTILRRLSYFTDYSRKLSMEEVVDKNDFVYPRQGFPIDRRKLDAAFYLKLSVTNSSLQDTFWLYLGRAQEYDMYEWNRQIRQISILNNKLEKFSSPVFTKIPYSLLVVKNGETKDYYIDANINFYNWHQFDPVIVVPQEQDKFSFSHFLQHNRLYIYLTLALLGVMLSMLVSTLVNFLQTLKKEYLYYTLAMLGFLIYFSFRLTNLFVFNSSYYFYYDLRYQSLQLGESIVALLFVTSFLNLKTHAPAINRLVHLTIIVQIIFLIINIPVTYSNRYNYIGNIAFDIMRAAMIPCLIYLAIFLLKFRNQIEVRFILGGGIIAIIVWALAVYIDKEGDYKYHFLEHSGMAVVSFMAGITLEMLMFLLALSHRKRMQEASRIREVERLQLENDRKELEKYKAVIDIRDQERSRISKEIHDEIGSGLTSIRLLSEIAKSKSVSEDAGKLLNKISDTASVLVDNMNEIIWTLNSRNDTLPNLISYLRHLIVEYFEPLPIQLTISTPNDTPELKVDGKMRRNILLCVKEAINNIAKHSQAKEVQITFTTRPFFSISVKDDGTGFNPLEKTPNQNGLRNIRERLHAIGGTYEILNNDGTLLIFKLHTLKYTL